MGLHPLFGRNALQSAVPSAARFGQARIFPLKIRQSGRI
jgi:hypothetical protein